MFMLPTSIPSPSHPLICHLRNFQYCSLGSDTVVQSFMEGEFIEEENEIKNVY